MSNKGWIKLSRDICDHWLWDEKPFNRAQAWLDLLMHASHVDGQKKVIKGELISWNRGQQIRSKVTLGKAWGWERKKVDRFLKMLEDDGMIVQKSGHLTTIISVCNYDTFQAKGASDGASLGTPNDASDDTSNAAPDDAQIRIKELQEGKELKNLPAIADQKSGLDFEPLHAIGFTDDHIKEIVQIRKTNKGKPIKTQRVVNGLAKEFATAINNGMTIESILDEWATRGWQSFKAEWAIKNQGTQKPNQQWGNTDALANQFNSMFDNGDFNQ